MKTGSKFMNPIHQIDETLNNKNHGLQLMRETNTNDKRNFNATESLVQTIRSRICVSVGIQFTLGI